MSISSHSIKDVGTAKETNTLDEAIEIMRKNDVDDVIVVQERKGEKFPVGILTGHDVIMKGFIQRAGKANQFVGDVMSKDPVVCKEKTGISSTIQIMKAHNVKRVPVVNDRGALVGIITASDFYALISEELSDLANNQNRGSWNRKRHLDSESVIL